MPESKSEASRPRMHERFEMYDGTGHHKSCANNLRCGWPVLDLPPIFERNVRGRSCGVSIMASLLDEKFFVGTAVWIPKLEGDGVDNAIVAILSITEWSGSSRSRGPIVGEKRRGS